jgi:iron(II)-dependent oxidoreductase
MRQAMALGGLLADGEPPQAPLDADEDHHRDRDGWVDVPGGPFLMGARPQDGFSYDNERPSHEVDVPAFRIARRPVTNGTWMRFAEGGGYERREWWSDEGWSWKQCYDITDCPGARVGHPGAPVCHVSWFEAEAFATANRARLPTEAEWEKAATSEHPDGLPVLADVGCVWEWTASDFRAYPGFVAHPYREYSEVFFDRGHRVLRGGSWATSPRVATPTFRNWDLPQRRQIFAGLRLAADHQET